MRFVGLLVGAALFLGFAALAIDSVLDLQAFPAEPRDITVAEAVALNPMPRGMWVRVVDARAPCEEPEAHPTNGGNAYRIIYGATTDQRIVVDADGHHAKDLACNPEPHAISGVLSTQDVGRIVGLDFPARPWDTWPSKWQTRLSTFSGPLDARLGVLLSFPMALVGALLMLLSLRPKQELAATSELYAMLPEEPVPEGLIIKVLPQRPLRQASDSIYGLVIRAGWFFAFAALFGVLTYSSILDLDGTYTSMGLVGFSLVMTLVFLALMAAIMRGWWRERRILTTRVEFLADISLDEPAQGIPGNESLHVIHPVTGVVTLFTRGYDDPPLLTADGQVLLVSAEAVGTHLVLLRAGFMPFKLSPREQRESLRRLKQLITARRR